MEVLEEKSSASAARAENGADRPWQAPVFVIGVPRSGTSLLYGLMNQHPQIALLYEGDLPLLWPMFLKHRSRAEWLERWNFWSGALERHNIDVSGIPSDVSDMRGAIQAAYRQYARQKDALIWGCKSADQYDDVEYVAKMFPNARFVIVWRDPADVCRSVVRAREMTSPRFRQRGLVHRLLFGCVQLAMQCDKLKKRGVLIHELRYEQLIASPADELTKICKFLNIDYNPKMESLQDADRSALPPGEHNALAAGEKIIGRRKQAEVLPENLKTKIERYKTLWGAKHPDWQLAAYADPGSKAKPGVFIRVLDRALYRWLRLRDLVIVFAYSFLPMRMLLAYRILQGRYYLSWQEYARGCTQRERPWLEKE